MLKIAYFTNQYPKTSHTFIRREILALEKQGIEIKRLSIWGEQEAAYLTSADKEEHRRTTYLSKQPKLLVLRTILTSLFKSPVKTIACCTYSVSLSKHSGIVKAIIYFVEACLLKELTHNAGVSHIHVHFGTNPAMIAMLCRRLGGPSFSFVIHGPEEFDRPQGLALKDKTIAAKFVCVVSNYGRSQLFRWVGQEHWGKVHVIRCGIETSMYKNASPITDSTITKLVCVGRLCEQKGQLLLIEAIAIARSKNPNISLTLIGEGPMTSLISQRIIDLGQQQNIKLTGSLSEQDVHRQIKASTGLVLASFAEGLPVAIMEAMASKRPVISTYIAGIPELVTDHVNGFILPAGNVDILARTILDFSDLELDDLNRLGAAAQNRVFKLHDIDHQAQALAELIS